MAYPEFTTNESPDGIVFTILDGQFTGVKFQFGTVSTSESIPTDDNIHINFSYKIISDPTDSAELPENVGNLRQNLFDILYQIVTGLEDVEGETETIID